MQGVAQSSTGETFVVGQTNALGVKARDPITQGPFVAGVATTGTVDWVHLLPYDDGSSPALDARADGGPVVIGGGAAATHYDDAGDVALTVGYPGASGAQVAVTSDDRIVVADAKSVRAFGGGGGEAWAFALPVNVVQLTVLVADRSGGVWLGGLFTGADIPPTPPQTDAGGPGGAFLIHLDRDGAQIGRALFKPSSSSDSITFVKGVVSADAAAVASLIVTGLYQGTIPDLMLTPSPYGTGGVAAALDGSGAVVWVQPLAFTPIPNWLPFVIPEASGTFLILTPQFSAPPDPTETGLAATRWDAGGQEIASTTVAVPSLFENWIAAPAGGGDGAIVTGEAGASCSTARHFLFHVGGADLQFQQLPFMLDKAPVAPGGNP